jgi:hypothetical protein
VRPKPLVASAVLTVVLAVVALPGLAGSRTLSPDRPIEAAAFQAFSIQATNDLSSETIDPLDPAQRSANYLEANAAISHPGQALAAPGRPHTVQRAVAAQTSIKPPRYTLSGYASFYDDGTTAMRLPRGTVIRVCGAGGCLERVVNDYGPAEYLRPVRIIDMYRPDFFAVCGCPSYSGTAWVTVAIY